MRFNWQVGTAACLLLGNSPAAAAQAPSTAPEVASILAADRAWLESYGGRDAGTFDRTWAEEAVLVTTFGKVKSRAEERRDTFDTTPPPEVTDQRFEVSEQQPRVYGDAAVVVGRFTNFGRYKQQPYARSWRYSNFYVRKRGNWRLVSTQFAPIKDEAAKPD